MHLPRLVRRWRPAAVILLLLAAPRPAAAEGLSLAEAVSRALTQGYTARIARLEAGQAHDSFLEKRGTYLPHLFVTSGAGFSSRRRETLVALDENFRVREYGIAALASDEGWFNIFVDQLLFDARQWKLIEREKLSAEVASLSERHEREKLVRDVTRQYADVVRLQRLADLADHQVRDADWLDDQARTLLEAGRTVSSEREMVAIHREVTTLDASARLDEAEEARQKLWMQIAGGEAAAGPLRLDPESLPAPRAELSATAREEALLASPELRVLDMRREVQEASVGAAQARRLPTLGFRAGYSHYGTDRFDLFPDEWRVGIDLEVPLFDGFEARSAISGALKGVEIARLRYQSRLDEKRNRVSELVRRIEVADERLRLARRRAESSAERQRLMDLRLQSRRSSLEEALAARERSVSHAEQATNAFFRRFDLWVSLQYELGRLTTAVLGNAPGSAP